MVMEVSSQGLMLGRVDGFIFDYGIFTNLEPDHIGPKEHQSFAEYRACKARLFRRCRHGIVNADDANLAEILKGHTCTVETFALEHPADWKGGEIRCITEGKRLSVAFTAVCHHDREPELPPSEARFVRGKRRPRVRSVAVGQLSACHDRHSRQI